MTEIIYREVSDKVESLPRGRRISVNGVLNKLGVSRSGYYDWKNRKPSEQYKRRERVKSEIRKIYDDNRGIYGTPKITAVLRKQGETISERSVTKYMKSMGIRACYTAPYTRTTISREFNEELHNILKRDFTPEKPNSVWCTDITYIWTKEGFMYLSCIMDLYSRKIIAWNLARTLETGHVAEAINKALFRTSGIRPAIIHTDRGVQYTSEAYAKATQGIERSYSRKGNPCDNACIESFHALIKREWLNRFAMKGYEDAYRRIFEYIDAYYNTRRIHSHCGYLSPTEFEKEYYADKESA